MPSSLLAPNPSRVREIRSPCSPTAVGYHYLIHYMKLTKREKEGKRARTISFTHCSATLFSWSYRNYFVSPSREKKNKTKKNQSSKQTNKQPQHHTSGAIVCKVGFKRFWKKALWWLVKSKKWFQTKVFSWKLEKPPRSSISPYIGTSSKTTCQHLKNVNIIVLVKQRGYSNMYWQFLSHKGYRSIPAPPLPLVDNLKRKPSQYFLNGHTQKIEIHLYKNGERLYKSTEMQRF